jgi:CheY-like chemotaxis protein
MHGGHLWLQSDGIEGKGSTFTFLIPISQAKTGPVQLLGPQDTQDDVVRPLVLVVTNDDSRQQLIGDYLNGTGCETTVVAEPAALQAALKVRPPHAVLIDRKMGGSNDASGQPPSDFSDTLIQHKYRSRITPEIPLVIFSDDENGGLLFSLSDGEGNISNRTSDCLADVLQLASRLSGRGSGTAPVMAAVSSCLNGTRKASPMEAGQGL